jgi:hypothetical protein
MQYGADMSKRRCTAAAIRFAGGNQELSDMVN